MAGNKRKNEIVKLNIGVFIIKTFWVGRWNHTGPNKEFDRKGRRGVIHKFCFGPLETIIYGITNDSKFFYENHIIEGIQEGDIFFEYISKTELLDAICNEIKLCEKNNADEMCRMLQKEKENIELKCK